MRIYCDSCILIYFYNHTGPFKVRAVNRLTTLAAAAERPDLGAHAEHGRQGFIPCAFPESVQPFPGS